MIRIMFAGTPTLWNSHRAAFLVVYLCIKCVCECLSLSSGRKPIRPNSVHSWVFAMVVSRLEII